MLRSRAGMVVFGAVAFGSGFALITQHLLPRMWAISYPGTLIPVTACVLVGACWGDAVWQLMHRLHVWERVKNDV